MKHLQLSRNFEERHISKYQKLSNRWLWSLKHDGIQVITTHDDPVTRNGKQINNPYLRELLSKLPAGMQGEICAVDPLRKDAFKLATSIVMTKHIAKERHNELLKLTQFKIFNCFDDEAFNLQPYAFRMALAEIETYEFPYVSVVKLNALGSDFSEVKQIAANTNSEGIILTHVDAPYEAGRPWHSLKVKNMADCDGVIIGYECERYGENLKTVPQELWGTEKPQVSKLRLRTEEFGEISAGGGLTLKQKKDIYANPEYYLGGKCTIEYLVTGTDLKPRQPTIKQLLRKDN